MLDPWVTGIIVMVLLFVLLAAGVHIGVTLGLCGVLGMYLAIGPQAALGQIATAPFSITNSFTLAVIPMFILMGSLSQAAGIISELYWTAYNWLGRLPGGLAMATTMASTIFGAASGSTVANAAVFSRMAMPEMDKFGYDKRLAAGCIAASATLDALVPPSILMVIYGIVTEQSVGKLLIAGFLPGALGAFIYMVGIYVWARLYPKVAPIPDLRVSWGTRFRSLGAVWGITVLFLVAIGGIYLGIFTPSQGGGVGAFGAFLFVLGRRRLTRSALMETIKNTGVTTSVIFIIVVGGTLFARFLTITGLVGEVSNALLSLNLPGYVYFLCYTVLYLILGCFIEPISIMIITLPLMFPIMAGAGFDPIWLGVISVKLAGISLLTPPVGLNVYVVKSASPIPLTLEDVFAGILPFLAMDSLSLALLIAFPQISLFLPNLMS